jgi:hypothetical protein
VTLSILSIQDSSQDEEWKGNIVSLGEPQSTWQEDHWGRWSGIGGGGSQLGRWQDYAPHTLQENEPRGSLWTAQPSFLLPLYCSLPARCAVWTLKVCLADPFLKSQELDQGCPKLQAMPC